MVTVVLDHNNLSAEIDSFILELKSKLADEIRPLMEQWYGKSSLEMTSIYGIRYRYCPSTQQAVVGDKES
jgi:hypothetical protein